MAIINTCYTSYMFTTVSTIATLVNWIKACQSAVTTQETLHYLLIMMHRCIILQVLWSSM